MIGIHSPTLPLSASKESVTGAGEVGATEGWRRRGFQSALVRAVGFGTWVAAKELQLSYHNGYLYSKE